MSLTTALVTRFRHTSFSRDRVRERESHSDFDGAILWILRLNEEDCIFLT
ncbi:hypothetical protein Hanom_Chr14g01252581 [Helianthus anomalus]